MVCGIATVVPATGLAASSAKAGKPVKPSGHIPTLSSNPPAGLNQGTTTTTRTATTSPTTSTQTASTTTTTSPTGLPHTGLDLGLDALIGAALLAGGATVRRAWSAQRG
jgi:hypothetical protein